MQYHTKLPKERTLPRANILPDIAGQFAGHAGCVSAFALVPVEFFTHAEGDLSPGLAEPYTLVKNGKPDNGEERLLRRQGRQLMAILVADIVGYCRLMHADEAGTVRHLNAYKSLMADTIESHGNNGSFK